MSTSSILPATKSRLMKAYNIYRIENTINPTISSHHFGKFTERDQRVKFVSIEPSTRHHIDSKLIQLTKWTSIRNVNLEDRKFKSHVRFQFRYWRRINSHCMQRPTCKFKVERISNAEERRSGILFLFSFSFTWILERNPLWLILRISV